VRTALFWDTAQRITVFLTDVSVQPMRPYSGVKKSKIFYPLRQARYFVPKLGKELLTLRCVMSQKSADLIHIAAETLNEAQERLMSACDIVLAQKSGIAF